MKVSVIVPVYNVENYLKECLDSLINQTLTDIEIICVNDGSTDNSLDILEEYQSKDSRIKIITKENAGLGAGRNTGLKHIQGEYVSFIDSDDFLRLDAYEKLYENAFNNNSDLVIFKLIFYNEFGQNKNTYQENRDYSKIFPSVDFNNFAFRGDDILDEVFGETPNAWSKFYKVDFLKKYDDFYFSEGVLYEDVSFHVKTLLRADKISFLDEYLYYYRTSNSSSITSKKSSSEDIIKVLNETYDFLVENNLYEKYKNEFSLFKLSHICFRFCNRANEKLTENFFNLAKDEFISLDIKSINKNKIRKNFLRIYNNIISSNTLLEFESKENQYLKNKNHLETQEPIESELKSDSKIKSFIKKLLGNN